MPGKVIELGSMQGLQEFQIPLLRKEYGENIFDTGPKYRVLHIMWDIVREPMFILLLIACSLYFILGNAGEGIMMVIAIAMVTVISIYQEVKSSKALESLQQFTEPKTTVIRAGGQKAIRNEELLPGDIMLLEEGMKVPADAIVLHSNDLSINESIITGESIPVEKNEREDYNLLYQGCTVNSGKCIAKVTATGNHTVLGKIGKAVSEYHFPKTLLQLRINRFVRILALFGLVAFFIILLVNYIHYREFATSLLFALTLAMSAVPEEIPVAFSSFMALGAYKMSKLGIISRQPQIIENLGAITVLCLDKTGTITENKMQVKAIYDFKSDRLINLNDEAVLHSDSLLLYAALASESDPFDAMEKAIWEAYLSTGNTKYQKARMIYEYPLEGKPPMMTHVYQAEDGTLVAAKGAAERILAASGLDIREYERTIRHVQQLATKGYRVLGVAGAKYQNGNWPDSQDDFEWNFLGLIALYDPPKRNINEVLKKISDAKIKVKLLTGDYPETAVNIAGQSGIDNSLHYMLGEEIVKMSEEELHSAVQNISIFARMFPDAKVKVINALKANGEIVAMTGDGVNDGPALKVSDIGIAMGHKGTEIARQASDLVITDDNLEKIASAISEGRKIFNNLVKAIRYIISIHIPIILTASLPVILGWKYPNIFTPIHVIFLELIMGPTCSIFFEQEPVEKNVMKIPPRSRTAGLFTHKELMIAIIQGLAITSGVLILYYSFMAADHSIEETRTMVFVTLIFSNVFLTFTDRSFTKTIYHTSRYKNSLTPVIIIVSIIFLALLYFNSYTQSLFQLTSISSGELGLCFGTAFACVFWFEFYKWMFTEVANKIPPGFF